MKNFSPAAMQVVMASAKVIALNPDTKVLSYLPYEKNKDILITSLSEVHESMPKLKKRLKFETVSDYKDAVAFLMATCHQKYDDTNHMWFIDIP